MRVYKCRCGHETLIEDYGRWGKRKPREIKCCFCGNRDMVVIKDLPRRILKNKPTAYVKYWEHD